MPGAAPDLHYAFGLEPEEALRYLAGKDNKPSFDFHEVWEDAHSRAFTVAKAMRVDILQDIRGAVQDGMKKGLTVSQFRKSIEPALQAKGWWGKKTVTDPNTGKERVVQLGNPRRLELIYRTNLATAESAARYQDFMESAPERPYWMFCAVLDARTRPTHRALNGKVFRWDDPFWNTFWPPLDWGCRCYVRKLTEEQVRRLGLKVESSAKYLTSSDKLISKRSGAMGQISTYTDPLTGKAVSTGIGWNHNPGQSWVLEAQAWEKVKGMPEPLRRDYIADAAKNTYRDKMWGTWVEGILARKTTNGFAAAIGYMTPKVYEELGKRGLKPESPLIIANDKGILHAQNTSKIKDGKAISLEELKRLPSFISNYEAVLYDTVKNNILYVVKTTGGKASKVVVEVNYNLRGMQAPANLFNSAGSVNEYNLAEARYIPLDGKIK